MEIQQSGGGTIPTYRVLDVRVSATNLVTACRQLDAWIRSRARTYVCIAPVSTVVDARRDPAYRKVVDQSGMTTPDGMPLVWMGKRQGFREVDRTYGPDLLTVFAEWGQQSGIRHFFYGGDPDTNARLEANLRSRYPEMIICGTHAPGYIQCGEHEDPDVLEKINAARPDILWVGLGSPKQDFWMSVHRGRLDVPVMVGVGAAFDFIAGTKEQAPRWMRRSGLEWLFRLSREPWRLWRRYLIGNTLFLYWIFQETFTRRGRS